MNQYTKYNTKTGRIISNIQCGPSLIDIQCSQDESYIAGKYSNEEYYIDISNSKSLPKKKPSMQCYVDSSAILGLPQSCTAIIGDERFEINDGCIDLSVNFPGTYNVRIESFPYIPVTLEVYNEG